MPSKHTHDNGRVFTVNYHIVFCPKYRRPVLVGDVRLRLDALIRERITELGGETGALEVMPDHVHYHVHYHVHLFCRMTPNLAPCEVVRRIKGYTSRVLRQEFPELRWMRSLWTPSYFLGTTGHTSSSVVQEYIEWQRGI